MLVGREQELNRLRAALATAADGQAVVIEVLGEAGIGKTALLVQAATLDERFERCSLTAVAAEKLMDHANLHALVQSLAGSLDALAPGQRAALRALLGLDPAAVPTSLALVGSLGALLAVTSAARPLLVTVDDAHWLDDASRQVIHAVARRLGGERVVLVLAGRDERPSLAQSEVLHMAALDAAQSQRLLRDSRPDLPASVVAELHRHTGGNPLGLVELSGQLTARQASGLDTLGEVKHVPERIRDVHLARIAAL